MTADSRDGGEVVTAGDATQSGNATQSGEATQPGDGVPDGNLADLVRAAAGRSPDRAALVFQDRAMSWAELDHAVDDLARGLQTLGLQPGDRVAVQLGNTFDFPVCYAAVLRAGFVVVPVNTGYTAPELAYVVGDSGASVLVTTAAGAPSALALQAGLPALRQVVVAGPAPAGTLGLDELSGHPGGPVAAGAAGEDLAVVLYTSGTSGKPRGAMLPHRALLANLAQTARISPPPVTDDDVVLLLLPLFHIYGLNTALGMVMWHGLTGVLCERFDPVGTLEDIRRHHVTCVVGAPPVYVAWSMLPDVGDALTSVRLALSGAAPLPSAVLRRMLEITGHHVFEGYGLTETAPVLCSTLMSEVAKPDSIGKALPGVELRLLDVAGAEVEDGDPGEIVVRGANVFAGYWPSGEGGPDAAGWFGTGDIAYADADGDLHLVDRRRDMVLVSGFNVYPREVEHVLLTHPAVKEAAVIGIAHPYTGETVKALVVLRPEMAATGEELIAHCARSLARFKCPTAVEFVVSLPRTVTGKVRKGQLRELAG